MPCISLVTHRQYHGRRAVMAVQNHVAGDTEINHPLPYSGSLGGRLQGVHSVSINQSYRSTPHLLILERDNVPLNAGEGDAMN